MKKKKSSILTKNIIFPLRERLLLNQKDLFEDDQSIKKRKKVHLYLNS